MRDFFGTKPKCSTFRTERKSGPSDEEPLWIFQKNLFRAKLRGDFLDGKSRQTGLASGRIAAELRFHVINAVVGVKAIRIGPCEVERGITRRVSPLVRSAWGRSIAIERAFSNTTQAFPIPQFPCDFLAILGDWAWSRMANFGP